MTEMSNDVAYSFLEHYQAAPLIWDPKHKFHKDKRKVNDAWERISKEMNIPVLLLKKKKDALMAKFRHHFRRKKSSMKSGAGTEDIYKPIWFAYAIMESFLLPDYTANQTINTESEDPDEPTEEQAASVGQEEEQSDTPTLPGTSRTQNHALSSSSPVAKPPQTIRRRSRPTELQSAEQQMKEASGSLNEALKRKIDDDECDLYGQLLAKKLRKLPEDDRAVVMYEIDGIFINRYRRSSLSSQTGYSRPSSYASFESSSQHDALSPLGQRSYSNPPSSFMPTTEVETTLPTNLQNENQNKDVNFYYLGTVNDSNASNIQNSDVLNLAIMQSFGSK